MGVGSWAANRLQRKLGGVQQPRNTLRGEAVPPGGDGVVVARCPVHGVLGPCVNEIAAFDREKGHWDSAHS